jgi:hypothetical protein
LTFFSLSSSRHCSHIENSPEDLEDRHKAWKESARQKDLVWKESKSESADQRVTLKSILIARTELSGFQELSTDNHFPVR